MIMDASALVLALLIFGSNDCFVTAWFGPAKDDKTGSMFYISEDVANEPEAARSCHLNGWILASVKSFTQQKAIENLAKTIPGNSDVWIGLKLYREKGNLNGKGYGIWSDGTPFNVTKSEAGYHNWYRGEPLTFNTSTQTNQPTCVRLWTNRGYKWDDYYCAYGKASLSRYACETKIHYDEHNVSADFRRTPPHFVSNSSTVNSTKQNLRNLSRTIDQILTSGKNLSQSRMRQILETLDDFLNQYNALKEGNFYANELNLEVKTAIVAKNESLFSNYTYPNRTHNNIQVYLSPKLIEEASSRVLEPSGNNSHVQVNTVLYRNPALFQINRSNYETRFFEDSNTAQLESSSINTPTFGEKATLNLIPVLLSDVISVDVKNVDMQDLKNPVCIINYNYRQNFIPPKISDMISKVKPICAFWDFNISQWSTKGCKLLDEAQEKSVCGPTLALTRHSQRATCACNHMTHFSMLLDTTYIYAPKYLTHMTKLGCSISIICLFATITTILIFEQLRSKTPQQILLHLCLALFMVNILFVSGIDRRDDKTYCVANSVLMHFFLLTAWAFMLLEAIFIFLRIVKASYRKGVDGKVVPIGSAICYVIPALVSGITIGITREDMYLSEKYCWLSMKVLIPSLLVPVAIILSINVLIFVAVLYTITFKSKMFRQRVDILKVRQTLTRALCMVFLLGVPWLFGFFMLLSQHPSAKEAFAVCFTIFNTTQGVAIFIFYCAKQEQVRNLWVVLFNQKFGKAFQRARSSLRRPISRHLTSRARNENEEDVEKSQSDKAAASESESNERSVMTYPSGSRTTLDTDSMIEVNAVPNQNCDGL